MYAITVEAIRQYIIQIEHPVEQKEYHHNILIFILPFAILLTGVYPCFGKRKEGEGVSRRMAAIVAALVLSLFPFLCQGETVIYIHHAGPSAQTETIRLHDSFPEDSGAFYLEQLQIISQRDPRFNDAVYRYVRCEPFSKNGCGPASIHNALAVSFCIKDETVSSEVLKELMYLLAVGHNPAEYGLSYNRIQDLLTADADMYPALAELISQASRVRYVGTVTASKVMQEVHSDADDLFLMGRININSAMGELVDLSDALCQAGYPDATIALCDVSAGDAASKSPFCLGEEGHFIALMVMAGEFCMNGTIYVLDSCPRALRNEKLNDLYLTRYYFAESTYLPGFRQTYNATRVKPTVIMCTLKENSLSELRSLQANAVNHDDGAKALRSTRIRFASYVETFGTGTLMLRIRSAE